MQCCLQVVLCVVVWVGCRTSPVTRSSERTVIAIEFRQDVFDEVFLIGGFSEGSRERCTGDAARDQCSIPVTHITPSTGSAAYSDWAHGDLFLDFHGAEENQSLHDGIEALGTPTTKMDFISALDLVNGRRSGRIWSQYWYVVELEMDCSNTGGLFEVDIVGYFDTVDDVADSRSSAVAYRDRVSRLLADQRRPSEVVNGSRSFPRHDPNPSRTGLWWQQQPGQRPISIVRRQPNEQHSEEPSRQSDDVHRAKPSGYPRKSHFAPRRTIQFSDVGRQSFRGDWDVRRHSRKFTSINISDNRHRQSQLTLTKCSGNSPFQPPYYTEWYVGKCGYGNVFRYDDGFCEINRLN